MTGFGWEKAVYKQDSLQQGGVASVFMLCGSCHQKQALLCSHTQRAWHTKIRPAPLSRADLVI